MPPEIVYTEWEPLPVNQGFSRPLAALLRWWIQRQVTQAQDVQVLLEGAAQVWRSGCLPYIQVSGKQIVYRDIHLEQVTLTAEQIRFHLPFLQKKGEPFLEPLTVQIQAVLTEANINHSLPDLQEILCSYLRDLYPQITTIQKISIAPEGITWFIGQGESYLTPIQLISPQALTLITPAASPQPVRIDLGTDVQIEEFNLHPGVMHLSGYIIIRPGAPAG